MPSQLAGQHVVILGGEEPAVDAALQLTDVADPALAPASVTLVHRRDVLKADPAQSAEIAARIADGRLALRCRPADRLRATTVIG